MVNCEHAMTERKPYDERDLGSGDIQRLLNKGVAEMAAYACARSPFYRDRFGAKGVRPEQITSTEDLSRLVPVTTKDDVSANGRQMWSVPAERVVDMVTTSGTTGEPTVYPMTEGDLRRLGYNEYLSFTCAGLTRRDVVVLGVTMDKCCMAGLAYFEGLREVGAATVRVGAASPAMLLSMMERLNATVVVSVPSFLKRVADYAAETGFPLAGSSVRKLVCIGEPLRDIDFHLTPVGVHLAEAWGARLYSTYGVTELATSLCECDAGMGGHLHPELLYVEILDDEGRSVPDGQVGEIVATPLGVEAFPLLRFRTGDMAFLVCEPCPCGRLTPRIGAIQGRKNQMLKLKGTTVYPAAVQKALDGVQQVTDYVMVATTTSAMADELEVLCAVKGRPAEALEIIREVLRGELKVTPRIRIVSPGELQDYRCSSELRKKIVFIDRRQARNYR